MKCGRNLYIIIICLCLFSLTGCTEHVTSSSMKNNTPPKNINIDGNKKVDSKVDNNDTMEQIDNEKIIKKIFDEAKDGKVLNSSFLAKSNTITDVEEKLGISREINYIKAAKGTYANYPDYDVAFGFNKNSIIFETRSFAKEINKITLADLKNTLCKPDHYVKTKNEQIIGYIVNEDYKLLFVFDHGTDEKRLYLKHYSAFYPKGTSNSITGDKGRQW